MPPGCTPSCTPSPRIQSVSLKRDAHLHGLLEITMKRKDPASSAAAAAHPIFVYFEIDVSASMDDYEKLNWVQETMVYMIERMVTRATVPVFLCIDAFSTSIDAIVPTTLVTNDDNLAQICDAIWNMEIRNFTNFERALRHAADVLTAHRQEYPTHRIMHLFYTDGNANAGDIFPRTLAALIPDVVGTHHFYIGIGETHNSMILHQCSQNPRSEYWFISDPPHIRVVGGEILHKILYTVASALRVSLDPHADAILYDWQSDTWSHTLSDAHLLDSEMVKRIHIFWASSDAADKKLRIRIETDGVSAVDAETSALQIDLRPLLTNDIARHVFQQKVMSLMYRCQQYTQIVLVDAKDDDAAELHKEQHYDLLRNSLTKLHREIQMDLGPPSTLMASLSRDCKSAYKTLGTYDGILHLNSRWTALGIQHVYTPRQRSRHRGESKKRKERPEPPVLESTNASPGRLHFMS
jgi:hypothetical protein